jgi:hypothetical protein
MGEIPVVLPGGLEQEGLGYRDARIRPLDGTDLDAMRSTKGQLPAERVSALLARCVTKLGPLEPPSPEELDHLSVGDRDALTLSLRRAVLGDAIDCIFDCPACGETIEVELSATELLVPPYDHEPTRSLNGSDDGWSVRAPTVGTLVEAARESDPRTGARRLMAGCLVGEPLKDAEPDEELQAAAEALIAELDPQANLQIAMSCPGCDERLEATFDPVSFFLQELDDLASALYREVHALAMSYHWSERDILGLSLAKRRMYLEFLDETVQLGAV